ncbi:MAG: D-alanyl-D-alanine carboxypeptidase family protein [Pseudomonadota bacterium]|nr:D-alanyl-D-alanine carboxypeptidase family protein [Pseudomonadota bacterium]
MRKLTHTIILTAFFCIGIAQYSFVFAAPIPKPPKLNVESYVIMDFSSGAIIASKNADLPLPPASITKIMTSYIAFLELRDGSMRLDDEVLISEKAWKTGGSKMFIEVGKKVKVTDLLQGIVTSSGNDASVAMAEHISGDIDTFSIYMNQLADNLGLKNTNYTNPTGLPHRDLYTSARDIAVLSRALIKKFPEYYRLYSQKEYVFNEIKQYSRNKLLFMDDRVDGIKTGFTKRAGYCLAASSKRGNRRLITVVLGAKTPDYRIDSTKALLEYGFRFYETHKLYKKQELVHNARIYNGEKREIKLGVEEDFYISIPRRQKKNIKISFVIDQNIVAPIPKNTALGFTVIKLNGEVVSRAKLIALEDIKEGSFYRRTVDSILHVF